MSYFSQRAQFSYTCHILWNGLIKHTSSTSSLPIFHSHFTISLLIFYERSELVEFLSCALFFAFEKANLARSVRHSRAHDPRLTPQQSPPL